MYLNVIANYALTGSSEEELAEESVDNITLGSSLIRLGVPW